jgi:hypothetical protein
MGGAWGIGHVRMKVSHQLPIAHCLFPIASSLIKISISLAIIPGKVVQLFYEINLRSNSHQLECLGAKQVVVICRL